MDEEKRWQFLSEAHIGDVVRLEMRERRLYIGPKQREGYVSRLTPDRVRLGKKDPFVKGPLKVKMGPVTFYNLGGWFLPYESIDDYEILEQTDERFFSEVNIGDIVKLEMKKRRFGAKQEVGYVWELDPNLLRLRNNHPSESRPLRVGMRSVYFYNRKGTIKVFIPYAAIEGYEVLEKGG